MALMGIQQNQGTIQGYFAGLGMTGPFQGSINTARQLHFKVLNSVGKPILSFDGAVQSGTNLVGNYCKLNAQGHCTGGYGLWSVTPAP